MPSVPIAAALQSPLAQRTAAADVDASTQRTAATSRDAAILDNQQTSEVETTDADTQVHADAGGMGGQGRLFPDDDEETKSEEKEPSSKSGLDIII